MKMTQWKLALNFTQIGDYSDFQRSTPSGISRFKRIKMILREAVKVEKKV